MKKKALVLLSGGLDSATTLALAKNEGYSTYALTFDYGQKHGHEIVAAQNLSKSSGVVRHILCKVDLSQIGHSALTDPVLQIPKHRNEAEISSEIPITYVPARNTIFLAHALAWSEVLNIWDIFLGVNALDYSGYPDCREEFLSAFETLANLATKAGVEGSSRLRIHAPLVKMTKSEIIQLAQTLKIDFALTSSCYDPDQAGAACGACDACLLRLKGFQQAGLVDTVTYQDTSTANNPSSV